MNKGHSRALMTTTDREHLRTATGSKRYQATHRVRSRIETHLATDIMVLQESHEELYYNLLQTICEVSPLVEIADDCEIDLDTGSKNSGVADTESTGCSVDSTGISNNELARQIEQLRSQIDELEG